MRSTYHLYEACCEQHRLAAPWEHVSGPVWLGLPWMSSENGFPLAVSLSLEQL